MQILSLLFVILLPFLAYPAASAAVGGGDITFTAKGADPVLFSHDYHAKSKGIKCAACHFERFAAGTGGFNIHKGKLNKREFCGHCHNGMKSFDLENQQNCARCHKKQEAPK